ncbi:carbon starvation CstA family protein [Shigella flexneri]
MRGTRSGRFMLQELLGNFVPFLRKQTPHCRCDWYCRLCGSVGVSAVSGRGHPLGGVGLWPLFSISNQMLAAVALVLSTVVLIKMKRRYLWVTTIPAGWLLICTTCAGPETVQ